MITPLETTPIPNGMEEMSQDNKLRVLLIGNNPIQMSSLYKDLSDYAEIKFMTETSFTVEDSLDKIHKTKPNCILIDDSLDSRAISDFVEALAKEESLQDIPVTLLKTSNYKSKGYNGIQDFLLKDGLSVERLSKALINAIRFRKTHLYLYRSYKAGKSKVNSLLENKEIRTGNMLEKLSWWVESHKTKGLGFR